MRSNVYRVDFGHGPESWVVLSNNSRNRNLDTVLAARVTTTTMSERRLPTVVSLTDADPLDGFVLVDDIVQLYHDELIESLGSLSLPTMREISAGLRISLP
ncbi:MULTISPECIES: type II toxin-antitoxin system PemK/MazF family toxin [Mycobacterium]|uniref:type II toxin-antitoxin system PemK/MazF family toxin n=1 Tax=Mycobacterium TaxID=1763 RepID=UPI001CDA53BA|nr:MULTISPECIES: type II toxin-antitoxin system PemK/MazF family toxin [Mycobacterium]